MHQAVQNDEYAQYDSEHKVLTSFQFRLFSALNLNTTAGHNKSIANDIENAAAGQAYRRDSA